MHSFYTETTFYKAFERDLDNAQALVRIQSPFIANNRVTKLERVLQKCVQRGVRVCVFIQQSYEIEEHARTIEIAKRLEEIGIHVNFRFLIHEKLCIIDERILWDGSLNILSQNTSLERMTRWDDAQMVAESLVQHKLNECIVCDAFRISKNRIPNVSPPQQQLCVIGQLVSDRRRYLKYSQRDISQLTGVDQGTISRFERGGSGLELSSLLKICEQLGLELRPVPWYFTPKLDVALGLKLRELEPSKRNG